ncbi:MAG TPA: helix-turn-helix transcriptional regulator [Thermoanaerobaculia bacterium]|nr:helix-turn-helix transcriptional regulator [Thermoanaerobaculia bacterium]
MGRSADDDSPRAAASAAAASSLGRAVGARIKQLREERGWSQRELGARLGIVQSKLSKYEAGIHQLPLRTLLRVAGLFDVSTDFLLTGASAEPPPLCDRRLLDRVRRLGMTDERVRASVVAILDAILELEGAIQRRHDGLRPRRAAPARLPSPARTARKV